MNEQTLGWIFGILLGAYGYAVAKWILDRIKELKDIARSENTNGDGI